MLFITIFTVIILFLILVVHFVVVNYDMFNTTFDVVFGFPSTVGFSYTLEGVEFIYIVGGSVLVGALVIIIGTWVLDTKHKLKLLSMRRELKRLQQAIQETKPSLPSEKEPPEERKPSEEKEISEFPDSSTATPEDIAKSFEDTVEQSDDMLEEIGERSGEPEERAENMTAPDYQEVPEHETVTEPEERKTDLETPSDTEKSVPQETPIEAELVENDESVDEERLHEKTDVQKKDEE